MEKRFKMNDVQFGVIQRANERIDLLRRELAIATEHLKEVSLVVEDALGIPEGVKFRVDPVTHEIVLDLPDAAATPSGSSSNAA